MNKDNSELRVLCNQIRAIIVEENICDAENVFMMWEANLANKVREAVAKLGLSVLIYLPSLRLDDVGDVHSMTLQIDVKSNPTLDSENCGYDVALRIFRRLHSFRAKIPGTLDLPPFRLRATDLDPHDASLTVLTFKSQLRG